ncbi:hypothetical protein ACFVP3_17855 [Streptomyces sp. NPDC057806]|uniref:hypothetical protein n=1 Tax=Streptomyces sp. NPDC057806 TaxID=3346255 RepID=UPI0036794EE2
MAEAMEKFVDNWADYRTKRSSADPSNGVEVPSWRVQYTVQILHSFPAQWLTFSFGTLIASGMDIEFTETLVELFDAVMTTFRWSYA